MKKIISILLLSIALLIPSTGVYADETESTYVDKQVTATQEVTLTGEEVPNIIIKPDKTYPDDFEFTLYLTGAVFSGEYTVNDELPGTNGGVVYFKKSDTQILFKVNAEKSGVREDALKIPLYTTLKEDGKIEVKMDSANANVFPTRTFTFATLEDRNFTFEISYITDFQQQANLSPITIQDLTRSSLTEGTEYTLELDNNYIFTGPPDLELSGKYTGNVEFEIDNKNPSRAYLRMNKTTPFNDGTIILYDTLIKPSYNSSLSDVNLTLTRPDGTAAIRVGRSVTPSNYSSAIVIKEFEGGYRPTASGTAAPRKRLLARVDGEDFGEIVSNDDGTWEYSYPYEFTNLKPGKHVFAMGYYTASNERWFGEVTKDFEISPEKTTTTVEFKIGSPTYLYGDRPGYLDVPAYINDAGYAMLPLRAVTQTLGVETDDLIWNSETNTATIKKGDTTIICQVGNKNIYINNEPKEMETPAVINNGKTFLPMRAILNAFGYSNDAISWDKETKTVSFEV